MTIKILFVDDEPNVLSGLRRMLRGQRKVWEMSFANGGEEALAKISENLYDVIVSDMRMPGIDGATLLTKVSELSPNTIRLVLSGQSEHEKIFRAVGPAHQFLSKPCEPDVLIETVNRACGLHSQLKEESLVNITSRLKHLPSLPDIYHDLIRELNSDEACIQRVGEKIEADLAMAAKVLQLVNSSFFGVPRHVSCPKHAVAMLGLNIIRPLVLTASAFSQYQDPMIEGFSLEQLVTHSLGVATTARRIAEAETDEAEIIDDTFIAGLMHDVGKLVLAVNLPEEYGAAMAIANATGVPVYQAEQQVFSATHAEVGAHLLGLWGLPDPIVEAIAFHHRPSQSASKKFGPLTAIHVANAMRSSVDSGPAAESEWDDLDSEYIQSVGVSGRVEEWSSILREEGVA